MKRHHRCPPLVPDKAGEQRDADCGRGDDGYLARHCRSVRSPRMRCRPGRRTPAVSRPVDDPGRLRIEALRHMTPGDPDGGQGEQRIDEKDRLPGEVVDGSAAQQGADGGSDGGEPRPGSDHPAALGFRK